MAKTVKSPPGLSRKSAAWYKAIAKDYDISERHALTILEQAARCLDDIDEMVATVKKEGRSVRDRYGVPKSHPLLSELRGSRNLMRLLLRELCLDDDLATTGGNKADGFRPPRLRIG